MPIAIKMPALSPTMEEGTLAKWLVKVGDKVSSGDIMAEIETDKATMEFEAVDEGTIADIAVAEGTEGVKVGTVIATLAEEGEDPASVKPVPSEAEGGAKAEEKSEKPAEKPSPLQGRGLGEENVTEAADRPPPPPPPPPRGGGDLLSRRAHPGPRAVGRPHRGFPPRQTHRRRQGYRPRFDPGQRPQRPHRQGRRRRRATGHCTRSS